MEKKDAGEDCCYRREPKATEDGIHSFTHKEVGKAPHNFVCFSVWEVPLKWCPDSILILMISLLFHCHKKAFSGVILI